MAGNRKSVCAFCGSQEKRTREHLVPEWLSKLIADRFGDGEPIDAMYRFTDMEGGVTERSYQSSRTQVVVKAVCQGCNGGWMSQLEAVAKPIMTPLILGARAALPIADQVLLAHWAAKTVVIIDAFARNSVLFDDDDIAQVFDGSAPIGFHIRLGWRPVFDVPVDIVSSTAHVISVDEAAADDAAGRSHRVGPPNNFLITFAFGGLVVAVAGGPGIRRDDRWITGGGQPLMIWPPTMEGISWPPKSPPITSKDQLFRFHEALYSRVHNSELRDRLLAAAAAGTEETGAD